MAYEAPKPNQNPGSKNADFLKHLLKTHEEKRLEIRKQFAVDEEIPIYGGNDGIWRINREPYESVEDWRKNKDKEVKEAEEDKKRMDELYSGNDNADMYKGPNNL